MAYALPKAELIGIDLSERQIAEGRQFAAGLGFKNVRFEQLDLADARRPLRPVRLHHRPRRLLLGSARGGQALLEFAAGS